MNTVTVQTTPIKKLTKHLKEGATTITQNDVRFIIQSYYQIQDYRIALAGQIRSINQANQTDEAPQHELLDWLFSNMKQLEEEIVKAIDAYTDSLRVGRWLKEITGIGPILAGGLLCYLDVEKAPSVSHFYSYAGLNDNNRPWLGSEKARNLVNEYVSDEVTDEELFALADATSRRYDKLLQMCLNEKGKRSKTQLIKQLSKPPYNIELKKLLWKIGESFVKVSGKDSSLYGRLYKERKHYETVKNENKEYADQAKLKLETTNIGKTTEAYKFYSEGMLPPAHIQARAKRYAEKIFLSHLYDEMYKDKYGKQPAKAYVLEHLGHVDVIEPEVPGIIV